MRPGQVSAGLGIAKAAPHHWDNLARLAGSIGTGVMDQMRRAILFTVLYLKGQMP